MAEPANETRRRRTSPPASHRDDSHTKLMRAVRAACRRQGIDDDSRKLIQQRETGKASMSDMTLAELGKLLDHFNKGWKGPMGHRAHIGKVKALWWTLYWLGEVNEATDTAIGAFVRRQTGVSALRFLDHAKAASVIEALKAWCARAGVKWPEAEETDAIAIHTPGFTSAHHDRHRVLDELTRRLRRISNFGFYHAYLETALRLAPNHYAWTTTELDAGIRMLGKRHLRIRSEKAL